MVIIVYVRIGDDIRELVKIVVPLTPLGYKVLQGQAF